MAYFKAINVYENRAPAMAYVPLTVAPLRLSPKAVKFTFQYFSNKFLLVVVDNKALPKPLCSESCYF